MDNRKKNTNSKEKSKKKSKPKTLKKKKLKQPKDLLKTSPTNRQFSKVHLSNNDDSKHSMNSKSRIL